MKPTPMPNTGSFDAKYVSRSSDRTYRIYAQAGELYFIDLGGLGLVAHALTSQLGLIGMLIGSAMKKRAKRQAETLLQRAEGQDLEFLLRENKTNFKVFIPEIAEAVMEPPSFFAMRGKQAGRWNFNLRDGKKFKFEFENTEAMQAALNLLSGPLNGTLRVNVEWNEPKKKFQKKKTHH
jgi:hypothetical protein